MHLQKLSLNNFKNYVTSVLEFSPDINCVVGPNGIGKTNLLDAIYHLCFTKSAFNFTDQQNILHGQPYYSITGSFTVDNKSEEILCGLKKGTKKLIKVNKVPYEKISDHIGKYPCVLITPYDNDLIREGSEHRRRFFDGTYSQIDHIYLETLLKYNAYLRQRNALLKSHFEGHRLDNDLLAQYDNQIIRLGDEIFNWRKLLIKEFEELLTQYYHTISAQREIVSLTYTSGCFKENFKELFKANIREDIYAQRTLLGIHKDDVSFKIDDYPIKKFGSQGQQKSFVLALKLAQYQVIREKKDKKPLLMLDDIFDKLDDGRIGRLIELMGSDAFGQIFITDARPERSRQLLAGIKKKVNFIALDE